MIKFIPLLFLIMFLPVFAQESNDKSDLLQNQIDQLNIKLESLQNINTNLSNHTQELENKVSALEEHGIKFGIDEETLGKAISENQLQWREGDLIIASSTIIAFFGFGAFLTIKFSTPEQNSLYRLLKELLYSIFGIQIVHIGFIAYIVLGFFHPYSIISITGLTILFLFSVIQSMRSIFYLEYRLPEKKRIIKNVNESIRKILDESWKRNQTKIDED